MQPMNPHWVVAVLMGQFTEERDLNYWKNVKPLTGAPPGKLKLPKDKVPTSVNELAFYAFKIKVLSNVNSTKNEERSFLSRL